MKKLLVIAIALGFVIGPAHAARDTIRVVGSSTVYPFTTTVAEQFGNKTGSPTPIVEATGTGGGIKLFCSGTGDEHPDAVNASRPMKQTEIDACKVNGVTPIEVKIGIDAIILAMAKEHDDMVISTRDLYHALAKYRLVNGEYIENTAVMWSDINSALPNHKIEVLGPPPTSGTRDSFVELVMEKQCKLEIEENNINISEEDEKTYCKSMREDGAYIEAGENDNLIVQKLQANPTAMGIFGFSFLEENLSVVKGAIINDVTPEYDSIQAGEYPISRPLFVYFKKEHIGVIPNLQEFIDEYQSKDAIGEEGYLTEKGLITLK